MDLKLSKRLSTIISMCEPCDTIIDVGTDHGKVAITIANMHISNNVIAIDNKALPLKSCEDNAEKYLNYGSANFKTLLSEGLDKVDRKLESGIIITGIGYDNMLNIIANISEYNYKYLILSPHTKITNLIQYLDRHGIDIVEQKNVYEDEKYYYILKGIRRI